jgi:hypothetical protein
VGDEHANGRLLLMHPTSDEGPYARALARRGPGLHHVGIRVRSLDAFLAGTSGWLLHPISVRTIESARTAWLARPGIGTLIEVHEADDVAAGPAVVSRVTLPTARGLEPLLSIAAGLVAAEEGDCRLTIGEHDVRATALALGRV